MPVVYKIENKVNGNVYVGSALCIKQRRRRHFKDLKRGIHHSRYLQRAYDKYGLSNFALSIIEEVDNADVLIQREQYWIDNLKPEYNISKKAGSLLGVKMSEGAVLKNKIRNSGFGNGNAKIKESDFKTIVSLINEKTNNEIAKLFGVHRSSIERLLKRFSIKRKRIWSKEGKEKLSALAKKRKNRARVVLHCDKNWNIIKEYPSASEAAKQVGVNIETVINSCKNITGNYRNKRRFYFKYLEAENE